MPAGVESDIRTTPNPQLRVDAQVCHASKGDADQASISVERSVRLALASLALARRSTGSAIPAYDEQIEPLRTGMPDDDGKQPGDPAKAAAAILLALDSEDPPLRLALGNDAVGESLDTAKAELAAWERVGRSAVFD
jgi:hypothetical protein